jgi:hypothetical protein
MIAELQMKYNLPNSTAKMRTIERGLIILQTINFIVRLNRVNICQLSLDSSVLDLDSLCRLLLPLRLDKSFICLSAGFGLPSLFPSSPHISMAIPASRSPLRSSYFLALLLPSGSPFSHTSGRRMAEIFMAKKGSAHHEGHIRIC